MARPSHPRRHPPDLMPNRIIREGIITSERIALLSWQAEVFYRRLLSVVDDYGRYFGKPALLRAACFPLQIDRAPEPHIAKWLEECVAASLLRLYAVDGTNYVEVLDFNQQIRAKKSKYPDPINGADHPVIAQQKKTAPKIDKMEGFDAFWDAYPRKVAKADAERAWRNIKPELRPTIMQSIKSQQWPAVEFIAYPASWLNGRRWEDAPTANGDKPLGQRPSITCSDCGERAFTWTGSRCEPCWRKSQGMT